jgi:hypothetical protein
MIEILFFDLFSNVLLTPYAPLFFQNFLLKKAQLFLNGFLWWKLRKKAVIISAILHFFNQKLPLTSG